MGHLAKTVKQAQIMGAFEDFGQVKSVDVSCLAMHKLKLSSGAVGGVLTFVFVVREISLFHSFVAFS